MTETAVAVIQARMTSTRLPGKVLLPLAGRPVLWHVVERARRIPGLDGICVAIPEGDAHQPLAELAESMDGVVVVRGPEDDVLERYVRAAEVSGADIVVRITSDCPVLDPGIAGAVLAASRATGCYARTAFETGVPLGLDVEAAPAGMLAECAASDPDDYEREHVTPFIWRRPDRFPAILIDRSPDRRSWRLTLDEQADYELMQVLFDLLGHDEPFFDLPRIERAISERPEILEINAGVADTGYIGLPSDRSGA